MVDDIGQGQDVARQRISDDQSSAGCVAFKNFTGQAFLGDLLYEDIDRERAIDAIAMRYEVTVLDPENSVAYIPDHDHMAVLSLEGRVERMFKPAKTGMLEPDCADKLLGNTSIWVVTDKSWFKTDSRKSCPLEAVNLPGLEDVTDGDEARVESSSKCPVNADGIKTDQRFQLDANGCKIVNLPWIKKGAMTKGRRCENPSPAIEQVSSSTRFTER